MAQHCSFIVTNNTIKNIFDILINPPKNKQESCSYERVFGLYFIIKEIKTTNIKNYVNKFNGGRR